MTAAEYRHILKTLHWDPPECAQFFGVDRSTAYRWATDGNKFEIPKSIAMWLRYMVLTKITPSQVQGILAKSRKIGS